MTQNTFHMQSTCQSWLKLIAALMILLLAVPSIASDRLDKITSDEDLNNFVLHYYLHPQPELVIPAIEYAGTIRLFTKHEELALPVTAFFSVLFSMYQESIDEWKKSVDQQDTQTQKFLIKAMGNTPRQLAAQENSGMARNDIFWFAFFANGDTSYLDEIIGQLKYLEERKDFGLFLTAATAEWSLTSNSKNHLLVKATLETYKRNCVEENMCLIFDKILTQSPAQIEAEHREIISAQQKKGLWRQ